MKRPFVALVCCFSLSCASVGDSVGESVSNADAPYRNPAISAEARTADLLARMTLVEKIGQMCQYVGIEHIKKSEKKRKSKKTQS